ncbi:MAG: polysaccharide pyruvyl transferase family protein [Leucobacter sp.]
MSETPSGDGRVIEVEASGKRVVVIGDVSGRGRYHLGDEAMSEVAVDQLRRRGIGVTLLAGDPAISSAFYGVDAVPVFGFAGCRGAEKRDARLAEVVEMASGAREAGDDVAATIAAIKAADAVVIAGGGNMNATGEHHIYERLALKRIAEALGIPLFVSSQTVGPSLLPRHRELVREIAGYARVFGAREGETAALMRELCGDSGRVVHTLDDAILMDPGPADGLAERLDLPERYVVGSFTYHAFSTGLSREEYYRELASIVDGIAASQDAEVLLLPHMGVLGEEPQQGTDNDEYGHDRIVSYTTSGRVRSLPLLSARETFAVSLGAEFTVSTRYHPVIFGAALGVPAVGIVTSYYSAQRMRGALSMFGMESFAVPYEYWNAPFGPRLLEALRSDRARFADHSRAVGLRQREYQSRWWDGIAAAITRDGELFETDATAPASCEWTDERDAGLLAVARTAQEGTNMYRANNLVTVRRQDSRLAALEQQLRDARSDADRARRELAEALESIAELRHRMRPPGAELRDRVRHRMRRLRGGRD